MQSMKRKLLDVKNDLKSCKIKSEQIIEQDFINYISVPSLESTLIIYVATRICQQSDIKNSIWQHSLQFDPIEDCAEDAKCVESFNQIEKNILDKLFLLPLTNLLKDKVACVIRPIELQILEWIQSGRKDIEYMNSIYWNPEGTIDRVKTLEQLIDKDSGQHINSIYKSACTYCLEEHIPNVWAKFPENTQKHYQYNQKYHKQYQHHLIAYWTSIATKTTTNAPNELRGLIRKFKLNDRKDIYNCSHSVNKNMLTLALSEGNSLAVKYFWNKLTPEEINRNLPQWVNDVVHSMKFKQTCYQYTNQYADLMYFLLSKMNDVEQQREVFQKNSSVILNSLFLNWPWQRFLLPTIRAMWNFLEGKGYVQLLSRIAHEIKEGKTTEKLLRELWCDSPIHLRKCFIQYIANPHLHGTYVLCNLLVVGDVGTINAILNDATVEDKRDIVFSVIGNKKLAQIIYADKLPLFNMLIAETISKESDIKKLKERTAWNHGNSLCTKWILANNWQMVEKFCNWAFTSQEQIDYLKNKIVNKIEITYSLLKEGNYELVNQFINWCFSSEQEINQFKKDFATSRHQIVEIGFTDFCLFENFIAWCFASEQEINEYKLNILQSPKLQDIIFRCIAYGSNFEFIDKLISWCCLSNEEMKQFKARFVLSEKWMSLLRRFVNNYKVYHIEGNSNWELIRKLIKLFSPLEEELKIQLKEKITTSVNFHDFHKDSMWCPFRIEEEHLFRLIDNHDYNVGDVI